MAHRVDPNDWAAKRARQVQHAKDLKFNRANAVDEELTLKPKTNKRPGYLDSLDQIASKQRSSAIQSQLSGGDVFEKPLPATLALKTKVAAPSPGSDALGKAMKSHKGNSPKRPLVAEYIPVPVEPLGLSGRAPRSVDASELFLRSLRADGGTELDGTAPHPVGGGSRSLDPRRRGSAPTITAPSVSTSKPLTPSKSPTKTAAAVRAPLAPWSPAVSPRHHGGSSGGGTSGFSPTQQPAVVRSRLSLLKKKIRRSEEVLRTGLGDGVAGATSAAVSASAGFLRSRTATETSPGREFRQAGSGSGSGSGSSSPGRGVTPRAGRSHTQTPPTPRTAPGTLREETAGAGAGAGAGGGVRSSTDLSARAHPTQSQSQSQSQAQLEYSPGAAYEQPQVTGPQKQCPDCGRMFNPQPYERHVKICAKVFMQKARPFDSKMMRIGDNPELVALERKAATKERQQAKAQAQGAARAISSPSGSRASQGRPTAAGAGANAGDSAAAAAAEKKRIWKEQSEALRQAMKATRDHARAVARGDTDLPAYTPSVPDSSFIPCPHCGRRFSQKAGERHIPQCTNIKAKPKSLSKGSGLGGGMAGGGVAPGGGVGGGAIAKTAPPLPGRRLSGAGAGAGSSAAKGAHSGAGAGARAAPRR